MIVPPRHLGAKRASVREEEGPVRLSAPAEIDRLDLGALRELREAVDQRIEVLQAERRSRGLAAIEATAAEHGLTRADLESHFGARGRRPGADPSGPKYRHPKTGETWGGIGRKPNWIKAFEATGGRLEEIAVADEVQDGEGPVH